jgi:hypothetical protein
MNNKIMVFSTSLITAIALIVYVARMLKNVPPISQNKK